MNEIDILPAPEIVPVVVVDAKLDRERREFFRLLPELLKTHRNQYVAIHEGRVVGSGSSRVDVGLRAYQEYGYLPILVTLVTEEPPHVARIPTPRAARITTE